MVVPAFSGIGPVMSFLSRHCVLIPSTGVVNSVKKKVTHANVSHFDRLGQVAYLNNLVVNCSGTFLKKTGFVGNASAAKRA